MITVEPVTTGVAERLLASELDSEVVLTGTLVNGVVASLGGEVGMLVPSPVVADEVTSVEVITGVLESTGVVEKVLASVLATCVVPTVILVNGVFP